MKQIVFLTGVLLSLSLPAVATEQTLLLRQPSLAHDSLVFVYAGDIWTAHLDGSNPRRITSAEVAESVPRVSPDGSMIAFAASFENNLDVYVVAISGGQPRRLTWHPGRDTPMGWTSDGQSVTFVSARETDHGRSSQLYFVPLAGGLPEKQMEARVSQGQYDATGNRLAYISHWLGYNGLTGGSAGWKGYRGGSTPAVRVMNLSTNSVMTIPGAGATNFNAFWVADQLYFLSDREDTIFNLFRLDADSGAVEKITNEDTWDIRSAAGYGSTIVFEAGGRLKKLNLENRVVEEIVIDIDPDLAQLRTQWKDASKVIQNVHISPTGKRAIITARGEVFTIPIDDGSTRNITNTGTVREYSALWSPAGEDVAYIIESPEGQSLLLNNQAGTGAAREFELGPHFYQLLAWSKGKYGRIIFQDNHLGLHAIDPLTGQITRIATGERRDSVEISLSTDGRWLAFTQEQLNFHRDLMLFDFATGVTTRVTDGTADVASPAFSPDGQYLYFAASTNTGPLQVGLNMTSQERPYRAGLYALVLANEGASPLLPGNGDEGDPAEEPEEEESDENGEAAAATTVIDLQGLASRMVALPVAERNYSNLSVAEDGSLFYVQGS